MFIEILSEKVCKLLTQNMSWQETLDKLVKLTGKYKHKHKRNDRLFSERIVLELLNNKKILDGIQKWFDEKAKVDESISVKDCTRAEYFRQEGNRHYVQGVNAKALELYNDSIRCYPATTIMAANATNCGDKIVDSDASLAYANRSAVFFHWKQFKNCIADIKKAYEHHYPDNLKYKLLKREAECLFELGDFEAAKTALASAKKSVIDAKEKIKGKDRIISSIDDLWRKLMNSDQLENAKMVDDDRAGVMKVTYERNEKLLNASEGVKLSYNASVGRHLVADKNFKPGDVLIVEEPFASAVLQKLFKSHCRHCLQKADAMVPCMKCCTQTYCSEKCRKTAWDEKHYVECGHLVKLHEVGIASMALHVVLKTNLRILLEEHINAIKKVDESNAPFGTNDETIFADYKIIYSLATHTNEIEFYNLMEYALTTVALLFILRQENFFDRLEIRQMKDTVDLEYDKLCQGVVSDILTDKQAQNSVNFIELLYGSLIFQHIQQIVCNGIAVTGIYAQGTKSMVETYEQMRFGTALYPTVSLMNHSCDPNCIQTFSGNTIVIKANKGIEPGEELSISYGPVYIKQKWEERQNALKQQYFFTCECKKCKNGPAIEVDICAFKCQFCKGPISDLTTGCCPGCNKTFNADWYMEEHKKVAIPINNFFPPSLQAIEKLTETLKVQEKIFYKYHESLSATHNAIACSYAQLENYPMAKFHFGKALKIEEFIHGEESIEVGHNLETYSELLMECLQMNMARCSMLQELPNFNEARECLKVVQRAIKILSISSANISGSEELKNLQEREKYLLEILRSEPI